MLYRVLSSTIALDLIGGGRRRLEEQLHQALAAIAHRLAVHLEDVAELDIPFGADQPDQREKSDTSSRCAMPVNAMTVSGRLRSAPDFLDVPLLGDDPGELALELDDVSAGAGEHGRQVSSCAARLSQPRHGADRNPLQQNAIHQLTNSPIPQFTNLPEPLIVLPESTPVKLESPS